MLSLRQPSWGPFRALGHFLALTIFSLGVFQAIWGLVGVACAVLFLRRSKWGQPVLLSWAAVSAVVYALSSAFKAGSWLILSRSVEELGVTPVLVSAPLVVLGWLLPVCIAALLVALLLGRRAPTRLAT